MLNKPLEEYTKTAIGDRVVPIHEALDPSQKSKDAFSTGFSIFDMAMEKKGRKGMKDGDMMIISGKSGHGKTLMSLNLIKNFLDNGVPSVLFSYEVIIDNAYETFLEMGLEKKPNIYVPAKNVTGDVEWIKEKIKEADKKYFAKVVVIDNLDFVTSKNLKNDDYRRNEITNIVETLKTFALEEKKIIILLAHIIKTKDKQLANEDIADCRALVNIVDYIMFVGREVDREGDVVGNNGIAKLTKNRYTGKHVKMSYIVTDSVITPYDELHTMD